MAGLTARQSVEIAGREVQVGAIVPTDREELLRLHVEVFGPGAGPAWYDWKYREGQGLGTGVWHEDRLIAHCGGVPRTLWFGAQARRAVQIGDVMVHPQWRGVLTRRGPFFHASATFYERHVGAHGFELAFGFPNERHLRLGERTHLVWDAGPVHALEWDSAAPRERLPWWWRFEPVAWDAPQFDALAAHAWQAMATERGARVMGERSPAYLRWRYAQRPQQHYRLYQLRRLGSSRPAGLAVLDLASAPARWLDWIGPPELLPLAGRASVAEAARAGAACLSLWATPAVTQSLAASGFARSSITAWLGVAQRSLIAHDSLPSLQWWLMGGDTDFL